ncbi:BH0509 family protein [Bacillus sp. FSL M8-0256]|uniref:BH0509 family protein n=1 Tax=Bacillus sp. FSL M8-0256 TaxID=2954578 RepID=UPI0030F86ADE
MSNRKERLTEDQRQFLIEWLTVIGRGYSREFYEKMNDQELEKQYLLNVPHEV